MEQEKLISSPIIEFSALCKEELKTIELNEGFHSPYNIKAVLNGKIVGYIIVEERNPNFQTYGNIDKGLSERLTILNSKQWFLIRKIYFAKKYLYIGNLETMFDKLIIALPNDCDLWYYTSIDINGFLKQLGGFTELPKDICPNINIRIFSVYQRRNE